MFKTAGQFTSESVSEGHPDKIADQISDAILDAFITQDKNARVACETLVKGELVIIAGEVTISGLIAFDLEEVVRKTIHDIGYIDPAFGFDDQTCTVLSSIGKQSKDIAIGVDSRVDKELGAGDQGLMFGYATNETNVFMPAPITYAHRLVKRQSELRKSGKLPWLRPDAKSQVTLHYNNGKPVAVDAVVLSTQHDPDIDCKTIQEAVMEEIIKEVIPRQWLNANTRYYINPTGRFVIGGPAGDCGLTGRKIIVDTYGGWARHGGGCFSGKDPSKVDRSAAYAARYIAKNIVVAGLADQCEVQLSYAIGVAEPTSISINTFGTSKIDEEKIQQLVTTFFDLRPASIIHHLDLLKPIYRNTAAYGHFGRDDIEFSWENADRAEALADAARPIQAKIANLDH